MRSQGNSQQSTGLLRFGFLVVCVLVGSGCRSSTSGSAETAQDTSTTATTLLDPAEPASPYELDDESVESLQSDSSERSPTPLALYLNEGRKPEENLELERQRLAEYDEQIAACMGEAGFDYIPYAVAEFEATGTEPNPAEDHYVVYATLGYGISTLLGRGPLEAGNAYPNPNDELTDTMSEPELEAYYETLEGCEQAYYSNLNGSLDDAEVAEFYAELEAVYSEIDDRIEAEPSVVDAWSAWRDCMAMAGFFYENRSEIIAELHLETDAILAEVGPELLTGEVLIEDLGDQMHSRLSAVQLKEREIAQADLSCRVELDDTLYEARVRVEQEFLEAEHGRVDRLLLAAAENLDRN